MRHIVFAVIILPSLLLAQSDVASHLQRGQALYSQYIPGMVTPDNQRFADDARHEYETVLSFDANNKDALASLASLAYNEHKWEDAKRWNHRLIDVDPQSKEAYYTLGVISWTQALPAFRKARVSTGMKPDDPGPIRDIAVRARLRAEHWQPFEDAIFNLHKALEIDPKYDDAMAYLNLVYRYRADMEDTPEQAAADIAQADEWMQGALSLKQHRSDGTQPAIHAVHSQDQLGVIGSVPGSSPANAIRIASEVAAANLVKQVTPEYPDLARQAQISGKVRFNITIGTDGSVIRLELISGHPMLVQPAREAVQQYLYKPTLLNGQPATVVTTVEVPFTFSPT